MPGAFAPWSASEVSLVTAATVSITLPLLAGCIFLLACRPARCTAEEDVV